MRPVSGLLNLAGTDPRCLLVSVVLGVVEEHDLAAGLTQPRLVAAQASDDLADIRDVAATQPEDVRPACILLLHRAFCESRTASAYRQGGYSSDQFDGSHIHYYLH